MRRKKWGWVAVVWWLGSATVMAEVGLTLGEGAPRLALASLNGVPGLTLTDSNPSKIVLVQFVNSWSVASHVVARGLLTLYPDLRKKGVEILMVGVPWGKESPQRMLKFAKQYRMEWPVGFDGEGAAVKAFHVVGVPTSCLVGKDGKVLWYGAGTVYEAEFQALCSAALAGRTPALKRFLVTGPSDGPKRSATAALSADKAGSMKKEEVRK